MIFYVVEFVERQIKKITINKLFGKFLEYSGSLVFIFHFPLVFYCSHFVHPSYFLFFLMFTMEVVRRLEAFLNDFNGFDSNLLMANDKHSLEYICTICHNIINQATSPTRNDQHIFCHKCLCRALKNNKSCPICRTPARRQSIIPNKFVDHQILQLNVKCIKHDQCDWKGQLGDLQRHMEHRCEFNMKRCQDCDVNVVVSKMYNHRKNDCPKRTVKCKCGTDVIFQDMNTHSLVCPETEIKCPNNGCVEIFARKNGNHHVYNCQEQLVLCSFGCESMVPQKDLDEHYKNNTDIHLELATSELEKLKSLTHVFSFEKCFSDLKKEYMNNKYHEFIFKCYDIEWIFFVYPCSDELKDNVSVFLLPDSDFDQSKGDFHVCVNIVMTLNGETVKNCMFYHMYNATSSRLYGFGEFCPHSEINDKDMISFTVTVKSCVWKK